MVFRHESNDRIVGQPEIVEPVSPKSGLMRKQVTESDRLRRFGRSETQIRDVGDDRLIEIQLAALAEGHDECCGHRLGDRANLKEGVGAYVKCGVQRCYAQGQNLAALRFGDTDDRAGHREPAHGIDRYITELASEAH